MKSITPDEQVEIVNGIMRDATTKKIIRKGDLGTPEQWEEFLFEYARTFSMFDSLDHAKLSYYCYKKKIATSPRFKEILDEIETITLRKLVDKAKEIALVDKDPGMIKWYLARKLPEEFGDTISIKAEISNKIENMTDEQVLKILDRGCGFIDTTDEGRLEEDKVKNGTSRNNGVKRGVSD